MTETKTPLMQSSVTGFPVRRGKVRDVYDLGDTLLIVATDRISAFDVVLLNGIPDKGKILTALSLFWFKQLSVICPHHLITADVSEYPAALKPWKTEIEGRSMLVKKANVFNAECISRGYLAGTGWKEYQNSHTVCGIQLPAGMIQCDRLPRILFTPSTKAEKGHDQNIGYEDFENIVGVGPAKKLREYTIALHFTAGNYAETRGIIIADTKFEFGRLPDGKIILIDEVLTPDSSRFWPLNKYQPGRDQESFDKQFVRNYLESLVQLGQWDKTSPAPELPQDVVDGTRRRYIEAYTKLAGEAPAFVE